MSAAFDAIAAVRRLEEAGLTRAAAEAITVGHLEAAALHHDAPATREDVSALRAEISEFRATTEKDISTLKEGVSTIRTDISEFRATTEAGAAMPEEHASTFKEEIFKSIDSLERWILVCVIPVNAIQWTAMFVLLELLT